VKATTSRIGRGGSNLGASRWVNCQCELTELKQPRVDDRRIDENGVRFRFTSKILPPYLRKTKVIQELVPWL